ncbi:MAG: hypothetical protein ACR2PL_03040 [Dehalococcoidia bacterium]
MAGGSRARTLEIEDSPEEVNALFYERGWSDGLPILPPTREAVAAMLGFSDRAEDEVIAILPPRQGEATMERIAINAVMAGCIPSYLPVLIAAVQAVADPAFNLDAIQATTHPVAPLLIINGPIARELSINSGYNAFGQGFRANATIGRALRLILMNIGGGLPGSGDRATQGSPAKFSYCIAENERENPWEPYSVERGFDRSISTVTAIGCEGPHNIQDHYSNTGLGILRVIAGSMGQAGSNNLLRLGSPLLTLGPEHAATIAHDGYSKEAVKAFLFEQARFPLSMLEREYVRELEALNQVDAADPDALARVMNEPESLIVIVAGGSGKHSSWQPTFGDHTKPITVPIARRDGTPIASVNDGRRS